MIFTFTPAGFSDYPVSCKIKKAIDCHLVCLIVWSKHTLYLHQVSLPVLFHLTSYRQVISICLVSLLFLGLVTFTFTPGVSIYPISCNIIEKICPVLLLGLVTFPFTAGVSIYHVSRQIIDKWSPSVLFHSQVWWRQDNKVSRGATR